MARGDVLRVALPAATGGHEQAGSRPAVAVQAYPAGSSLPMLVIVPFTKELTALRFEFTFRVEPSRANGLTVPSVALVFQIRAIDPVRIIGTLGHLESHYLAQLDQQLKELMGLG
jgi:mRNA interferase MazF